MNTEVENHLDETVAKIRSLYQEAAARIEALKPGEKVPATQLAEELAKAQGATGAQLYPILVLLFKGYPGIEVRKGAHGGLYRPLPKPQAPVAENNQEQETPTEESTSGNS